MFFEKDNWLTKSSGDLEKSSAGFRKATYRGRTTKNNIKARLIKSSSILLSVLDFIWEAKSSAALQFESQIKKLKKSNETLSADLESMKKERDVAKKTLALRENDWDVLKSKYREKKNVVDDYLINSAS